MAVISGTAGSDVLNGTYENDLIVGLEGNDTIISGAGDDLLNGDEGDDTYIYQFNGGFDRYFDTSGYDTILVNNDDPLKPLLGFGSIHGIESIINTRSLAVTIQVDQFFDCDNIQYMGGRWSQSIFIEGVGQKNFQLVVEGTEDGQGIFTEALQSHHFDSLNFFNGPITDPSILVVGRGGDDNIYTSSGNDVIFGDYKPGDTAWNLAGSDSIRAGAGDDVVYGGAGDDTLLGEAGNDTLDGGAGHDIVYLTGMRADWLVPEQPDADGKLTITHISSGEVDILSNVEEIRFANDPNNPIIYEYLPVPIVDTDGGVNQVAEDAVRGALVGITAASSDPEGNPIRYGLSNNAGGAFVIDSVSGVVTVADPSKIDFEAQSSMQIVVTATDGIGVVKKTFIVNILDGNDAPDVPVDADSAANIVAENAAAGTVVGLRVQASDVNGDALSFSLVNDAGGRFAIDATTGVVTIADGSLLDYETQQSHQIVARVSDGQYWRDQTFTINVSNVPDAPVWTGTNGNDVKIANSPDDWTFQGLGGDDSLTGNTGNDVFLFSGGAGGFNVINGSLGTDTIKATSDGTVIGLKSLNSIEQITADGYANVVISGNGEANNLNFASTLLSGITAIRGGDGNDSIIGSADADTIYGDAGNDVLNGGAGDDVLSGGAGIDSLIGGAGDDVFIFDGADESSDAASGGNGYDVIRAASNSTVIGVRSFDGIEEISAGGFAEVIIRGSDAVNNFNFSSILLSGIAAIHGGASNDTITGGTGGDTIFGGDANDLLNGGTGDDLVSGDDGNDTLIGGAGADTLIGGAGLDYASYVGSTAVTIDLKTLVHRGDAAGDMFDGIEGFIGSSGADIFVGSADYAAIFNGSGGTDTVDYSASAVAVTVTLGAAGVMTNGSSGDAEGDRYVNIERVVGSAFDDRLTAALSGNELVGGQGDDVYVVSTSGITITELAGGGDDEIQTSASYSMANYANVERLTYTGTGNANLTGNAGANIISGGIGNDTLVGGAGADTLIGGAGLDYASYVGSTAVTIDLKTLVHRGDAAGDMFDGIEGFIGSSGADIFVGSADYAAIFNGSGGTDTVDYSASAVGVNVTLGAAGVMTNGSSGDAEGDRYVNIERVVGSAFDDRLTAALSGNELVGGQGDDVYVVSASGTTITELAGSGDDEIQTPYTVYSMANYANVERLTYTGNANANLTGNAGANIITGGIGNDTLVGGAGADTLIGGSGMDTASYAGSTAVNVDLTRLFQNGGDAEGDQLLGIENLLGGSYADILVGDAGANLINAGSGNDRLAGGAGADALTGGAGNDVFVFRAGFGHDTITDFSAGPAVVDVIEFSQDLFASFAAVMAAATQVGTDVRISLDADNSLLLKSVGLSTLNANDFLFIA